MGRAECRLDAGLGTANRPYIRVGRVGFFSKRNGCWNVAPGCALGYSRVVLDHRSNVGSVLASCNTQKRGLHGAGDKRPKKGCAGRLRLNVRDMRRHTTSYRSGGAAVLAACQDDLGSTGVT